MSASRPSDPPLTRAQAEDVLRYYRESLKLEEALDVRPKARRVSGGSSVPRIDVPTPGQEYFKLPLDASVAALLAERTSFARPFDAELAQFFETWLHGQYRRAEEEGELSHLLCFPVVHMPRGELAGLLRHCVRLRFAGHAGESFRAPTRAERERGLTPAAPVTARLAHVARDEGAWPFFVDTRLLRHPLGVPSESVDALFEALRAREQVSAQAMLALVTRLLEHTVQDTRGEQHGALLTLLAAPVLDDVAALLARLTGAMETLLGQGRVRARVYGVAIVVDGSAAKTSFHLQRELGGLLQYGFSPGSALGAYLTGSPVAAGRASQRALFDGPPLTAHQRRAAESFWGSTLTAVQGPPGTGKTTLILHLCAEALVRKVEVLADTGAMGDDVLLVTSSNNRAVDNVIEGLERDAALPLALRAGSRQVSEEVLARQLRRALTHLQHAASEPATLRSLELSRALEDFAAARAALATLLAPRLRAEQAIRERVRLDEALRDWHAERLAEADAQGVSPFAALPEAEVAPLLEALLPLDKRLSALARLCEANPGLAQVNAIARHYGRTANTELVAFEAALSRAGLTLALPLPPLVAPMAPAQLMEAWEEATEQCLGELGNLREELERQLRARKLAASHAELVAQRAALGDEDPVLPALPLHDEESWRLYAAALAVREAWAKSRASELCAALSSALRALDEERTLRPLFRGDPESARLLTRLFGVWGVTLLSLGNCFPPDEQSVAHVVIDEAGQCHPAHAVSALLRARSALVIGDVHQLAPVVELSADDELRLLASCRLEARAAQLAPYRIHASSHVSAQSLADRAVAERLVLVDHFRCQREIIAISDALCDYGLTVHTQRETRADVPLLAHPVLLHDLVGSQERLGSSLVNELERDALLALVARLLASGVSPRELAVITPYRGQLEQLRRGFVEQRVPLEYSQELGEGDGPARANHGLALGTVHRFQGGERSIVLFSSVITRDSSLPFLNARPNLLNVAVSRARHHFVALGHRAVLARGQRTRLLVDAASPLVHEG